MRYKLTVQRKKRIVKTNSELWEKYRTARYKTTVLTKKIWRYKLRIMTCNYDFFLAILSSYLTILIFSSLNSEHTSHNSNFAILCNSGFLVVVSLYLANLSFFSKIHGNIKIYSFFLFLLKANCNFLSHNSDVFSLQFYIYIMQSIFIHNSEKKCIARKRS